MAFKFELTVCLLISVLKASQCQVQCFDQCGSTGVTLSLTDMISTCCNNGGGGFIDLLNEGSGCQDCVDLATLQAFLSVTGNISLGSDSTLDCTISSPIQNLNSDMQWIGPDGTVLQDVDSVTSLRQSFTPFQTSDLGDYTCISTISSPDFPGVTSTVSSTVTINPPPDMTLPTTIEPSSPSQPSAGEDYSLECVVDMDNVTIQWIGPDGMIISNEEGIMVGTTMSSAGQTTSTLTFSNIATSRTGRYTCQNSVEPRSMTVIVEIPEPQVEVTDTDVPPVIGEPYTPECSGSVPPDLEGSVTVSWITPNGVVVASSTSNDSASVPLPFEPFEVGDVGQYTCRVRVTSQFLDGRVGAFMTVQLEPMDTTDPPTTGPDGTGPEPNTTAPGTTISGSDPSTTIVSPPLPTIPAEVDECALGLDNCSKQRACTYSYKGKRFSKECRQVASCTDTPTGFQCTCNEGFSGDGILCRDVNECARNVDDCHPGARCLNMFGGFRCRCRYSYIGDGVDCCIKRSEVLLFDRDSTGRSSTRSRHSSRSSRSASSSSRSTSTSKSTSKSSSSSDSNSNIGMLDPKCSEVVDAYLNRIKPKAKSRSKSSRSKSSRSKSSRSKSSRRRSSGRKRKG